MKHTKTVHGITYRLTDVPEDRSFADDHAWYWISDDGGVIHLDDSERALLP